jgi:hypothetical protein
MKKGVEKFIFAGMVIVLGIGVLIVRPVSIDALIILAIGELAIIFALMGLFWILVVIGRLGYFSFRGLYKAIDHLLHDWMY